MKLPSGHTLRNTIILSVALCITCTSSSVASVGKPLDNQWLHNFYSASKELDQKLYKDAHRDLMKCLDQIGNDPVRALTTISLLERLFEETGDNDSKEKVLKVHLQILKGYQFPQETYAQIYVQLAEIYGARENYQKALSYLNLALPLVKKANGEYSVDAGVALNNLAYAELKLGKFESAEIHYKQSLDAFSKSQGVKSLFYAFTASNLGDYYEHFDKLKLASEYFQKALEAFEFSLGSHHSLTQEMQDRLEEVRERLLPDDRPPAAEIKERKTPAKQENVKPAVPVPRKYNEPGRFPDFACKTSLT